MSSSEIALPLLFMADGADLVPLLICLIINVVLYAPVMLVLYTPAAGIPLIPIAGIAAVAIHSRNHYAGIAFWYGTIYSAISIFLWLYLIRRIRGKTISRGAIQAAYALSYAQWGIWYILGLISLLFYWQEREMIQLSFLPFRVDVYSFAVAVSLSNLLVSFVRLYRARWDPKFAIQEPRDGAWFAVRPASVYVMPFLWSNLWLTWLVMIAVNTEIQPYNSQEPTPLPIVYYMFVVAVASIIWMLWSPMKLVAQRAKHMIGKQTES